MMAVKIEKNEPRTREQLKQHYDVESELARRLRDASRQERRHLYASVYDELYRRVPLHPAVVRKATPQGAGRWLSDQMRFLRRFVRPETVFLEVGAGTCALSFAVARMAKKVYALEVSHEIAQSLECPRNFELVLSDGVTIPIPERSATLAYSHQVMEHLHPDDALQQLRNVYASLVDGGVYICVTPNRLNGPHDISKYFDPVASGFHMKEYTNVELYRLFRTVGFSRIRAYIGARGQYIRVPFIALRLVEAILGVLPPSSSLALARRLPLRPLLTIRLAATK